MRAYEYAPESEPKLASPSEVLQAVRALKVGQAPRWTVYRTGSWGSSHEFLTKVFNEVLRRQFFPSAWEHSRGVHTEAGKGHHAAFFL
jgi:hypothetical protein